MRLGLFAFVSVVFVSVAFVAALLIAAPAQSQQFEDGTNEQSGRSGQPLAVYCNVAPEFSVQRSDSVDNWLKICSLWLNNSCAKKDAEPERKARFDKSAPGFRLIGQTTPAAPGF